MVATPAGAPIKADLLIQTVEGRAQAARREGAIWPGYRSSYQLHPGHLQHLGSAGDWIDQILLLPIDQVEGGDVIPPDTIVRIVHRLLLPVDFHIALVVGTVLGVVDMRIVEAVQLLRRHPTDCRCDLRKGVTRRSNYYSVRSPCRGESGYSPELAEAAFAQRHRGVDSGHVGAGGVFFCFFFEGYASSASQP